MTESFTITAWAPDGRGKIKIQGPIHREELSNALDGRIGFKPKEKNIRKPVYVIARDARIGKT